MDEESRKKLMGVSQEQLYDSYRAGKITAGRYHELVHAKAKIAIEDANLENPNDYVKMLWQSSVKHFQEGWDNVVEAATRKDSDPEKETPVLTDLYYAGLGAWGAFQAVMAPMTAFGEVNGETARRLALGAGASPGAAWYIGLATDLTSGFIPAGKLAQGGARTVQGLSRSGMLGKTMKQLASGVAKQGELAAVEAPGIGIKVPDLLGDALQAEGKKLAPAVEEVVQPVEKVVSELPKAATSKFGDEVAAHAKGITIAAAKEELPKLAEKLGIDLNELHNMTPGGRFDPKNPWYDNPKKMYGYLKALESRASEIGPLAKAALQGDDNAKMQFAHYMANLFTESPDGKMRIGKEFTDMMMHWDPENMAKGDWGAAVTTFAKDMAHMADTGGNFANQIFTNQKGALTLGALPDLWQKARNLYLNGLLPMSWKAAFLGNTYTTGMGVLERATGAMFSSQSGKFIDIEQGGKAAYRMSKALMMAQGDGIKAFGDAYKLMPQVTPQLGRFAHANPWDGTVGQIINIPMNTVKGMDNYFAVINQRAVYYDMAMAEAESLGLTGSAFGRFVVQRLTNPTGDMITAAKEYMDLATFQNQLGGFAGRLQRTLQWGPLVFYFPFMKSAVNLAKYTWDRTPGLQLISLQLYKDIAAGGAKADAAIARLVMGQMLGHYYMELAKDGYITGGGPVDSQQRRSWLATHVPYSLATGTGWVPLSNHEPMNTMPGMIADVVEVIDHLDPLTAEQAMAAITFAAMRNFTNGTWWQNASALQDAVQTLGSGTDFTNPAYRFLRSPISAPFQGLVPITRAIDPIARESRSYITDIRNKIPWMSKEGKPMRDGFGDPVVPPQAFGGSWFGLLNPIVPSFRPYEQDPLKKEAARLGVKVPLMNDHLGGKLHEGFDIHEVRPEDKFGIRLNDADLDQRQQLYRDFIRHPEFGIEAFMKNPDVEYNKMPDALKRSEFERQLTQAWQHSGDALMVMRPDLGKRILESDARSILAKTPDQERETVLEAAAGAIGDFMDQAPEEKENLQRFGIVGDLPDTATYSTPYGPLQPALSIKLEQQKQVPIGTPGALPPQPAVPPTITAPGSR